MKLQNYFACIDCPEKKESATSRYHGEDKCRYALLSFQASNYYIQVTVCHLLGTASENVVELLIWRISKSLGYFPTVLLKDGKAISRKLPAPTNCSKTSLILSDDCLLPRSSGTCGHVCRRHELWNKAMLQGAICPSIREIHESPSFFQKQVHTSTHQQRESWRICMMKQKNCFLFF